MFQYAGISTDSVLGLIMMIVVIIVNSGIVIVMVNDVDVLAHLGCYSI